MIEKIYKVFNLFIIIFITVLTVGSIFIQDYKLNDDANSKKVVNIIANKDIDKLKNKGYSKEEINVLKNDKKLIKIVLDRKYNKDIINLMKIKGFKNEYLDEYLKYYKNNNTLTLKQVVISVNNKK